MVIPDAGVLDRRSVVARLLRDRDGILVVTGLGSPSYDVHAAGDDEGNYYLWGAMGAAALVGLGLAQAQIDRTVVVITGDGEQLMGLGGLATVAVAAPANLVIVVLDNGAFGETGMQQSHTAAGADLAAIAKASGIPSTYVIEDEAGLRRLAATLHQTRETLFACVRVAATDHPRVLPEKDGVTLKTRFRAAL